MTNAEKVLASRFLKMASDSFSNHGCNDVEADMFAGLMPVERIQLEIAYNTYNCPNLSANLDDYVEYNRIGDSAWMGFFAHLLAKEADESSNAVLGAIQAQIDKELLRLAEGSNG